MHSWSWLKGTDVTHNAPPKHPAPSFPDWKSMPARTEMQISGAAGKDWHSPVFDGILSAALANPDRQAGGALTGPKHSGSAPHQVLLNQPSEHTTESQPPSWKRLLCLL